MTLDQSACPTREHEHEEHEGKERRAGGGRRIALYLDEIERQKEKAAGESRIEQKRQQVRAGEVARPKQGQRQHRRRLPPFDDDEDWQHEHAERDPSTAASPQPAVCASISA